MAGKVKHKKCKCQFCRDYKRLKFVLPQIPKYHRKWVESIFEAYWNTDEELSYKNAILDGSWPNSVEDLQYALDRAILIRRNNEAAERLKKFGCVSAEEI